MTTIQFRAVDSSGCETVVTFRVPEMDPVVDIASAKFEDFISSVVGYDVRTPPLYAVEQQAIEPLDFPALHPADDLPTGNMTLLGFID